MYVIQERSEPVFLNVYGAQESIPPAYVAWGPARHAGNSFLGSLKGLQIRAQKQNFRPKYLKIKTKTN
jgi:hypothetical protein